MQEAKKGALKFIGPVYSIPLTFGFYDPQGLSYIAKPATGQSFISHHRSALNQSIPLVDPLVTLFGSVHEKMSERGSKGNMLYPNLGSILNAGEYHNKNAHWDIESQTDGEDHESEASGAYCDESLRSPLISCQTTSMGTPRSGGSALGVRCNTILMKGNVQASEAISSSMDTGGGWQLAYIYSDRAGEDGKKEGGVQRVYLHLDSALWCQPASVVLQERKLIHAGLVPETKGMPLEVISEFFAAGVNPAAADASTDFNEK
ncbi:hypothetical protein ACFX13_027402 [Malus domestica]